METVRPHREICVTGTKTIDQLFKVAAEFVKARAVRACATSSLIDQRLVIGVLASSKTLRGLANHWPMRYPRCDTLKRLFALGCHAAEMRLHLNISDTDRLVEEVELAHWMCGERLSGIQLNMCWPPEYLLTELHRRRPETDLLLQIGANALLEFEATHGGAIPFYDVKCIVARVGQYGSSINRVLLDPSGGCGVPMNVDRLRPVVEGLNHAFPNLGIGVAGGLCAETLLSIAPLIEACPTLSIDAEGRLRNPDTDELDMGRVEGYLTAAFDLFYPQA